MSFSPTKVVYGGLFKSHLLSNTTRLFPVSVSRLILCRCHSSEAPNSEERKIKPAENPQQNQFRPSYDRFHGQMIQMTAWKKRFLFLSGRWRRIGDIPDLMPEPQYNKDMWVTRVRLATGFMVLWLFSCLLVAKWGRKHEKEKTHRIVMQQYLETLSDEERRQFEEEFGIKSK